MTWRGAQARVPYARESMVELLGAEPASYASADTAQALALAAYRRAVRSLFAAASYIAPGG